MYRTLATSTAAAATANALSALYVVVGGGAALNVACSAFAAAEACAGLLSTPGRTVPFCVCHTTGC